MLPSRSSASRSAAGLYFHRVESYRANFGGDGLEVRSTGDQNAKSLLSPKHSHFFVFLPPSPPRTRSRSNLASGISILIPVSAVEAIAAIFEFERRAV